MYAAAVDQGFVNGKRRRNIVFGKTVREVAEKLPHLQVAQQSGMLPPGKGEKLGAYLAWWIAQRAANRTTRGYAQIIDNHITPALGRIALNKLTATHIDAMLNALRGELSETTRHHIRAVLSVALAYAERKGLVARNVARLAEPIAMPIYKGVYLDVAQANALLDAAKGHRLEALFTLAVYLGMRQGELLGLRWKDVDFERGTIRVFGQLQAEPGRPRGQDRGRARVPEVAQHTEALVTADQMLRARVENDRVDDAELLDRALEALVLAVARPQVLARVVRRRRQLSDRHVDEVHEACRPGSGPGRPFCASGMSGSTPGGCCARRSRRAAAPGCDRRPRCARRRAARSRGRPAPPPGCGR